MNKEEKQLLETKKRIDKDDELFKIQKSYVTKEEFIQMLSLIEFQAVISARLELLTGVIITKDEEIRKLYKNIDIDQEGKDNVSHKDSELN